MSEIKHTPGPWVFDEDECSAIPALHLYCADSKNPFHGSRSEEELKANARLIAAAPELLEALKEAIETIKFLSTRDNSWGEQIVCEDLQAIVAKATGSQS
jgi:hypothetical protein